MSLLRCASALSGLKRCGAEAGSVLGAPLWSLATSSTTHGWAAVGRRAFANGGADSPPGSTNGNTSPPPSAAPGAPAAGLDSEPEDPRALEAFRSSKNFRRRLDGRVQLYGKEYDNWMEAKLDGYVEGSLLLLGQDGLVYYLVSEDLKQIDLSNDALVGQLFGEGGWERLMQPLYTQTPQGDLKHVKMTLSQFRSIFTVLKEAPPPAATQS